MHKISIRYKVSELTNHDSTPLNDIQPPNDYETPLNDIQPPNDYKTPLNDTQPPNNIETKIGIRLTC